MTTIINEIYDQPAAIQRTLANINTWLPAFNALNTKQFKRIVFAGMGASFNSLYPSLIYLMEHHITALAIETAELLYYYKGMLDAETLLVVISQSGESVETRKLVQRDDVQSPIICITNSPLSTLGKSADLTINLDAGEELTIASKTYLCTQVVLYLLAHVLTDQVIDGAVAELKQVANHIESQLADWHTQARELATQLPTDSYLTLLGRGPSQASAHGAALALRETAKVTTVAYTGSSFRHGSIEAIDNEKTVCIIFAGVGRTQDINIALANDLAKVVKQVIVVGNNSSTNKVQFTIHASSQNEWLNPIIEIIPFQFLAVALAERRGIEAGTFRFIAKVITHE
jgi:glutamine---fructose-6-phosphate transaminase (isomerizing)